MAGSRKKESDLPPRTYQKRGAYYYVSRQTGTWIPLGRDKDSAVERARELYDGTARDPTAGLDLSALHGSAPNEIGRTVRTAMLIMSAAREGAISRNLSFEITTQDVIDLLAKANGRCMATGIEFCSEREHAHRIALWKPSLDRIDSTRGYVIGNVRIVCAAFNICIQDFGDEVFRKLAVGFLNLSKMGEPAPGYRAAERMS